MSIRITGGSSGGGGAPTGAAGGDLSGTYPNPTVRLVAGGFWSPVENGLIACNCDPAGASVTGQPVAGVIYYHRMAARQVATIASVVMRVTTLGSSMTSFNVAVFVNGTQVGTSGDQKALVQTPVSTPSIVTVPITVVGGQSLTVARGDVIVVAFLCAGGTSPQFNKPAAVASGILNFPGPSGVNQRFAESTATGQTSIPTTIATGLQASALGLLVGVQ